MVRRLAMSLLLALVVFSSAAADGFGLECRLDKKINEKTFASYVDEIGNIFGSACGRNRGIFVTDPPDGHTYNCAAFPERWGVADANSVKTADPSVAVPVLNEFVRSIYLSTPEYVRARDPGACDFEAMSELVCGSELPWQKAPWSSKLNGAPIRGVNLGGLFVLTRWITPGLFTEAWVNAGITDQSSFSKKCASLGVCAKYQQHIDTFYAPSDFVQMKLQGINTVRVPVGYWLFEGLTPNPPSGQVLPKQHILDFEHPLTKVVSMAMSVGLSVILDVEPVDPASVAPVDPGSLTVNTATAVGQYLKHVQEAFSLHNIILVEIGSALPNDAELVKNAITQLRLAVPDIPVLLLESSTLPSPAAFGAESATASPAAAAHANRVFINTKVRRLS